MYIDNMTITAVVVFVIAMAMFVKKCFINSCIIKGDSKAGVVHKTDAGEQ